MRVVLLIPLETSYQYFIPHPSYLTSATIVIILVLLAVLFISSLIHSHQRCYIIEVAYPEQTDLFHPLSVLLDECYGNPSTRR